MKFTSYLALFALEPEGGYTVTVPALPGLVTYGETLEEARDMVKEAIELYLEDLLESGELIPEDEGKIKPTALTNNVQIISIPVLMPYETALAAPK